MTSFIKKIRRLTLSKYREAGHFDPVHDWFVMVVIFSVVLILILVASIFFYTGVDQGFLFKADETEETTLPVIKKKDVKAISDYYRERDGKFRQIESQLKPAAVPAGTQSKTASTTKPAR